VKRILLRFRSGSKAHTSEIFPLAAGYSALYVGRDPSCDVRFDIEKDAVVSRNHAVLEWGRDGNERVLLNDLLSTNGTFVNGKRIAEPTVLASGDVVQFGRRGPLVEFVFESTPEPDLASWKSQGLGSLKNRTREVPIVTDVMFRPPVNKPKSGDSS
jgi:hypothetical protein